MSLKSSINPPQIKKRLAVFFAVFALLVQPMYALVASQVANAVTAVVVNQAELEAAIDPASGKNIIQLGASFSVDTKISLNRSLTLNGEGYTITSTRNNNPNDNSNNATLGINNTAGVTLNNLTVTRGAGQNIHGINIWRSTAVLNDVTITGFNNGGTKYGLLVGENSQVTVYNITTSGNSRGINVDKGAPKLTVNGQSSHGESTAIFVDSSTTSYVVDTHSQYQRTSLFGHWYSLKSAPSAPAITAPATSPAVTTTNVNATWNAPSFSSTRNAAASYNVSINGGPITNVTTTNYTFDGLTDGTYTISVQSVAASGLVGGTATQTFTVELPDTTPPTFAITNPVNGSYVRGTQTINAQITDESDISKVLVNIAGNSRSWTNGSSATISRTGDIFSTTIDTKTIADGPVHVVLRGTDGAGNTRYWNNNASNRQHVFYVDNTRPVVELVSPVGASYNPVNYEVKATDNLALQTVTAHIYDAAGTTLVKNCSSTVTPDGADEYNLVCPVSSLGLSDGTYTIRYNAADKAGNIAVTKTATFTIDAIKPTIHVKGQGNTYTPTSLGQGNIFREVSFKLFDGGRVDRVEINGVNKNLSDSTWSDVNNVKPGVSGAVEGNNTLVAFDVAGNSTTYEFVLDTTAPKITVKPGYIGTLGDKIFSNVSFALEDYGSSSINKLDKYTINGHLSDFSNNKWSDANFQNIKAHLVEGENTLVLYDEAGNSSSYTFIYDATKPTVKVNLNRSGYLVSGGVTNSASVPEIEAFDKHLTRIEVWKDGAKVTGWTTVNQNATTYKKINWLGNGTYVIRAFDAAGLVSDDFTVTIDNTAPTGTFAYSHSNNLTNQDVTVTLTTSEEVQDIAGWTRTSANTFTKIFTANGKFTVAFTDIAGNNGGANGEVKRIDKVVPVFLNIADGASIAGSSFVIQVQDPYNNGAHGIYEKLIVDGSPVNLTRVGDFVYEATISGVGSHTVTVRDKAGNEATITFLIGDAVPASVVTITNHERNDDGTYTIRGTTTHPTDTVKLWFVTEGGHVEIEGVVVDVEGNWSVPTGKLTPGEYELFALTTNEQGVQTPVESTYTFEVKNNNGGGQQGGAEEVLANESADEEDRPTLQSNPIAFLPATLGTTGFNDGTATTPLLRTAPSANSDDSDADVLGAEDVRADWSVVNAAMAGFIAILAVVALAGIRRKETDNNTGARVFMLVPAAAAIIAFFVIDDLTGSMIWFNVWTWLFAGILVVQAILATLTTKTAND
ncbi:MAG TPA: Ig-like domain-containing protein [Candidatus Saccharibacteria bacterium]|nr:Ig-like domain-containing protein [Candidatus Saccharibacteria bacterium]